MSEQDDRETLIDVLLRSKEPEMDAAFAEAVTANRQSRGVDPRASIAVVADAILAAGFRRTPAPPQVLEAFAAELREHYPEDVFTKPTDEDYAKLHAALVKQGLVIDRFSADLMRRAAGLADAEAVRLREEVGCMSVEDEVWPEDWTAEERAAYETWLYESNDGDPGEEWDIQAHAWLAGYRASRGSEESPGQDCTCRCSHLYETECSERCVPGQDLTTLPFVAIGFDGGTTLALTGDNAGHWVEGSPTHVRVSALSRAFAHLQELRGGDIEQEYLDSAYAEAIQQVRIE